MSDRAPRQTDGSLAKAFPTQIDEIAPFLAERLLVPAWQLSPAASLSVDEALSSGNRSRKPTLTLSPFDVDRDPDVRAALALADFFQLSERTATRAAHAFLLRMNIPLDPGAWLGSRDARLETIRERLQWRRMARSKPTTGEDLASDPRFVRAVVRDFVHAKDRIVLDARHALAQERRNSSAAERKLERLLNRRLAQPVIAPTIRRALPNWDAMYSRVWDSCSYLPDSNRAPRQVGAAVFIAELRRRRRRSKAFNKGLEAAEFGPGEIARCRMTLTLAGLVAAHHGLIEFWPPGSPPPDDAEGRFGDRIKKMIRDNAPALRLVRGRLVLRGFRLFRLQRHRRVRQGISGRQ